MIALLLGSFNPIHKGHVAIAQYTLDNGLADEIWFVVSPQNPLKSATELAPFEDRFEMVKLAISGKEQMVASDIEATLPYPSYTINTLRELHKQFTDKEFLILAGSDIKEQLPLWREHEEVQRLARFLIYPRGENHTNCSPEMDAAPLMDIDSTICRAGLYPLQENVKDALTTEVLEYILSKKLYAVKTIKDYDQLIETDPNEHYHFERGRLHYQNGDFGKALNDFNDSISLNPDHTQARQMKTLTESIFEFRHTDIYNP